jgi:hypothetical protein
MAAPSESQSSKSGLSVPAVLISGDKKGAAKSAKINEDITMAQANAIAMNDYLPVRTPLETDAVIVEGFTSRSAEYTLSVIGILCIVYGIVAK